LVAICEEVYAGRNGRATPSLFIYETVIPSEARDPYSLHKGSGE